MHSSLIMVPMGMDLAHVVFIHHFKQKVRKSPDDNIECVCYSFLAKALLMCMVVGLGGWAIMERVLILKPK